MLNFRIAHLINENFVLYGDWERRSELLTAVDDKKVPEGEILHQEGIYVRMGELVYSFIPT